MERSSNIVAWLPRRYSPELPHSTSVKTDKT